MYDSDLQLKALLAGRFCFDGSTRLLTVFPVARRLIELVGWEIGGADSLLRWAIPLQRDL